MELKTVFVDNDSDVKCLDTISKSLPSDILEKAIDKSKLTQKEITDKNGNRRKVWVKSGEDQKQSKPSKKTEEPKDSKPSKSSVDFTLPSHGDTKKAVIELASKHSKQDIMNSAKQQGITWKSCEKEGINWMRASMAIQKAMKDGTIGKTKADEKTVETPKAENNSLSPKVFSEDAGASSVTGGGSRGQLNIVRRNKSEYIMVQSTKKDGTFGKPMKVTLLGNETPQKALERMKNNNPNKQWRFDPDSLEPKKAEKKQDKPKYTEHPTTKAELKNLIKKAIEEQGDNADLNHIDVSKITDMSKLFSRSNFNGDISQWDVSNVKDMKGMFYEANSFNQPLNNWDVSKVEDMSEMFRFAKNFNQPLNNWDVSKVTDMNGMFEGAYDFNQPLDNWDVSNVGDMSGMFCRASAFNQPIGNWDVSKVENMGAMFCGAWSFNQPLDKWDVSNVINMHAMFSRAEKFNQPLNNWDVSKVEDMSYMLDEATTFNQPLNSWDVSNVENMEGMFYRAKSFNQPLNNWDVSKVEGMSYMFDGSPLKKNPTK